MPDLPTGTVTLLFTDIEGSTNLLQRLGGEQYATVLAEQRDLLRHVFHAFDGHEVDTQGDAFFVAFARATDAVSAAVAAQRALFTHSWPEAVTLRVRMGLHTGEPVRAKEGYVGLDVHHAARIMRAAHGGQVLLSQTIRELVEHTLPAGVALHDLGEHRLKDLQRASHLFQLVIAGLPADFPALRTLDTSPNNLPVQPTAFLGREKEIAAALRLLMHENIRLLTLTGPGGTGKTRLALQVAAEASDHFADGVYFVDLAPLNDPELVVANIAHVLNVTERGGQPLLENLKTSLREKQMLLLLDNFEQVVQAAPAIADLLVACPKLKMLVTSRMTLHVRAEQEFAVPPLTLPDPKHLPDLAVFMQYEAVTLFIQRARAVKQDFQVTNVTAPAVAEICVRLDGLPLAIELAAARIKLFPPPALLARLGQRLSILTGGARDAPARQQTLRDTIAWSYQLLDESEQRIFRVISVFVGGCTLDAIEAICTALGDIDRQVVDGVVSLIDKSLLQQTAQEDQEPRFAMLETIREYGLEMLASTGELEATRRVHATYYLALAEEAEPGLRGAQQLAWVERLEQEHDNLRAVLAWSVEPEQDEEVGQRGEIGLRLGAALRPFWVAHSHFREGQVLLKRVLSASAATATVGRAKALVAAADLAILLRDRQQGEMFAEEGLVLSRNMGDIFGIAFSLYVLGWIATGCGEYDRARSLLEEALTLFREVGNKDRLGWTLNALGNLENAQGMYVQARARYEEALSLFRQMDYKEGIGVMLCQLACILMYFEGDLITARSLIDEGYMHLEELGETWSIAGALSVSAEIALNQGDIATARLQSQEALALNRELGDKSGTAELLSLVARVEVRQRNYMAARDYYDEVLMIAREINDKWNLPIYLNGLAEVAEMQGEFIWAARLLGAAELLLDRADFLLPPVYQAGHENAVAAVSARLGEQAFAIARAEGRSMTLDQVLGAPGQAAAYNPT
jgi:predicted ATPase/class 3 adenylate cyclase